jgi:hypothetical protein
LSRPVASIPSPVFGNAVSAPRCAALTSARETFGWFDCVATQALFHTGSMTQRNSATPPKGLAVALLCRCSAYDSTTSTNARGKLTQGSALDNNAAKVLPHTRARRKKRAKQWWMKNIHGSGPSHSTLARGMLTA